MKGRFAVLVSIALVISACTKNDYRLKEHTGLDHTSQTVEAGNIYVSNWEPVSQWTSNKSKDNLAFEKTFRFPPSTVKLLQQGVVLVFVKNLWEEDPLLDDLGGTEAPLQMPFQFLPFFEQPGYTEQWNYEVNDGQLDIMLTVKGDEAPRQPKSQIQLQYIVIPPQKLDRLQLAEEELRKMTYEEVLNTLHLTS